MTVRTQEFLLHPGEELLLSESAVQVASRFQEFLEASGLDPDRVLVDPICAIPIPIYEKDEAGRVKRFANAKPEFMWHPVMWLPQTSALRYQMRLAVDSDETRFETDHEWAIRVALELRHSGLYSPESGGWLDILALHNIDIEHPVDYARVENWLAGGDDDDLDAVDLTDIISTEDDREWSLAAAQELSQVFIPAQWSMSAHSLLMTLEDEGAQLTTVEDLRRLTTIVCSLTLELLADVPPADDDDDSTEEQILDIYEMLEDPESETSTALDLLNGLLVAIRDDYSIAVEALEAVEAEDRV